MLETTKPRKFSANLDYYLSAYLRRLRSVENIFSLIFRLLSSILKASYKVSNGAGNLFQILGFRCNFLKIV